MKTLSVTMRVRWAEQTLVTSRNTYERAVADEKLIVLSKQA
jgi:hypothetical protein